MQQTPVDRARQLLRLSPQFDAIVLTRPGSVAWAIPGINPPIDRTAGVDTVWIAIGAEGCTVITTGVEKQRISDELLPDNVDLVAVPWWDGDAMVAAAAHAVGVPIDRIASDGHSSFGVDLDHELTHQRLALDPDEQRRLRELGKWATAAVEDALRSWEPGQIDTDVAARIASGVERFGADAPVLLVGADDRLNRYRHPVAVGAQTHDCVMAVLVARHQGLHVALTRYVSAIDTSELESGLTIVRGIHRDVLRVGRPGRTYGDVLDVLAASYAQAGYPEGWNEHYQGGPIGYAQREFEISPAQRSSPWWNEVISEHTAVAWNPSLAGGLKDEDTYLISAEHDELITTSSDWPMDDDSEYPRPLVLKFGS
jgi:antitoxin VapB